MSMRRRVRRRGVVVGEEVPVCDMCAKPGDRGERLPLGWVGAIEVRDENSQDIRFRFSLCDACG